mgnify:CR=1 FL=1
MSKFKTIFLLISILFLSSCSTTKNTIFESDTNVIVQIDSSQYDIIGNVKGESTIRNLLLLFDFGYNPFNYKYAVAQGRGWEYLPGILGKGYAYDMALYNAIEEADQIYPGGIDAIITPRYTKKVSGFFPFYKKTHIVVEGKGIRFKTKATKKKKKK